MSEQDQPEQPQPKTSETPEKLDTPTPLTTSATTTANISAAFKQARVVR